MFNRPLWQAFFATAFVLYLGQAAASDPLHNPCSEDLPPIVDAPILRVLTLNASHGRNTSINQIFVGKERTYANLDAIAGLLSLAAADVVALQEADGPSRWSGRFDHVEYIADRSDYGCVVHGLHSQSWISSYGTALMTRAELLDPASIKFQPSPPSKQKGYVSGQIIWDTGSVTQRVTVASVHFDFLSRKTRDAQVSEMVAGLSGLDGPLIVLGDLNSEWDAEDSHVQRLARELDLQAYKPEEDGHGTYKKPTGKRLDWILVSRDLAFSGHKVLPDIVADHFAVYAEITYRERQE
jgi:endonuclease/exonuclease/phosphatase family metal-dependent hydrolase